MSRPALEDAWQEIRNSDSSNVRLSLYFSLMRMSANIS